MNINSWTLATITRALPLILSTIGKQRLMTLIYHRVLPEPDFMRPSEPDVTQFSWQMELLARYFNPLGLREAGRRLREGRLPERAVCVTFDDGYADNLELALPILEKYGIPATVFVATGFLNGGRMWNDTVLESVRCMRGDRLDLSGQGLGVFGIGTNDDRRRAAQDILTAIKHLEPGDRQQITDTIAGLSEKLPDYLMLSDDQVRVMHTRGVEIGGHTHSHPILASLDESDALAEIELGKKYLESLIGEPVTSFAYPNGRPGEDFLPCHRNSLASMGFTLGLTTQQGVASKESDVFMLPRFTPWDKDPVKFTVRLLLSARKVI